MSTTRVLIDREGELRRLLKLESSPDGSILLFFDLDPKPPQAPFKMIDGYLLPQVVADGDELPRSYAKISCHTTGVVHYYSGGQRETSFFIDPLYELSEHFLLGMFSVPRFERCDRYDAKSHKQEVLLNLPVSIDQTGRISVAVIISPIGNAALPGEIATIKYELYEIRICIAENLSELAPTENHIISLAPSIGKFEKPQVGKVWAELNFHQKVTGADINLFFEKGVYILLTAVPMRIAPMLSISFIRTDLSFEIIPFESSEQPTHKLKFYIKDRSGRNKTDDYRSQIETLELDAEL